MGAIQWAKGLMGRTRAGALQPRHDEASAPSVSGRDEEAGAGGGREGLVSKWRQKVCACSGGGVCARVCGAVGWGSHQRG